MRRGDMKLHSELTAGTILGLQPRPQDSGTVYGVLAGLRLARVTVAPITGTIRGLSTEAPAGTRNGLAKESVVSVDSIVTVPVDAVGRQTVFFFPDQEGALSIAIRNAFDLD